MTDSEAPKRLTKQERLEKHRAQINAQLRDISTAKKARQREIEDSKKFGIGGHFYEWMKAHPHDTFSKALQAHMEDNLRGKHYRNHLGLSSRPDLDQTIQQARRATSKKASNDT